MGLTFTIKTLGKYTVGFPDAAELSLTVNRHRTRPQKWQGKSRTLNDASWYDFTHRSRYTTTRHQCNRYWHPPSQVRRLRRSSSNPQFDSSTRHPDSPIRHLQQPTTTLLETATHIYFSTHFIKVSRVSSLIISFHFTLYRHDKPYWLWLLRYDTIRWYFAL